MPDVSEKLGKYLDYIWEDTPGFVYVPTIHGESGEFTKFMFEWPAQKRAIIRHTIFQDSLGNDVYMAPAIFSRPAPDKDAVKGSHVFWVDMDGSTAEGWDVLAKQHNIPEPTMLMRSSIVGREHAYWKLAKFETDISQLEARNRALAYTLKADTGGWDADQILRPPFTHNYGWGIAPKPGEKRKRKPWYEGTPISTKVVSVSAERVNPNVFNTLGTPEKVIADKIVIKDVPNIEDVLMQGVWPDQMQKVFRSTKEEAGKISPDGRSGTLQLLAYLAVEQGFSDEQTYSILEDADDRWEKYTGRHNRGKYLVDAISRARAKHGYLPAAEIEFSGLLGTKDSTLPVVTDAKLVYSFQEFMDLDVKVDWLLKGMFPVGGIGIFAGDPGTGKTQLCVQLGAAMSLGQDFLIWKNDAGPKKVMLLSLEMGAVGLKILWNTLSKTYVADGSVREISRNFNIVPLGEDVPFDSTVGQAFVDNLLGEYHPDVLIIDSLGSMMTKELSDEAAVKHVMKFLKQLRTKHQCSILMVHHNRKKSSVDSGESKLDDLYGSRYIGAQVDFALNLKSNIKDLLEVACLKNRFDARWDTFDIKRDSNLYFTTAESNTSFNGLLGGTKNAGNQTLRDLAVGTPGVERAEPSGMGFNF